MFRSFKWDPKQFAQLKPLTAINYIVIHHTESHDVPIETVDQWHRTRSFAGVGYHYLIRANGDIEQGRPENKMGAQVLNHNHESLGVCLTGKFMETQPTSAQMDSLVELVSDLMSKYPKAKLVRHKDLAATNCPGDKFPWDRLNSLLADKAFRKREEGVKPALDWKNQMVQDALNLGWLKESKDPDAAPTWAQLIAFAKNVIGG